MYFNTDNISSAFSLYQMENSIVQREWGGREKKKEAKERDFIIQCELKIKGHDSQTLLELH